jgi:cyclic beta-1,2-glucan synthetase
MRRTPIENIQMRTLSDESIITTAIDLAKTLRMTTAGMGISTHSLYSKISQANRIVSYKNSRKIPLYEAEKWLFENFYLVYRNIFGNKNIYNDLPHINNVPRIITLARHIVRNSLGVLTLDRVRNIFDAIKTSVSLDFMEIKVINQAISFAVIEELYVLSERILFQNECYNVAKGKKIDKKLLKYDSYCFYLFEYGNLNDEKKEYLEKLGISKNKVALSHNKAIMENTQMAETLFTALHNINDFVPVEDGIKYLAMSASMEKLKDYNNVSTKTKLSYYARVEKLSKSINISEAYITEKAIELAEHNDIDISVVLYDHIGELRRYVKSGILAKLAPKKTVTLQRLYIAAICIIALVLCYSAFVTLKSLVVAILTFIPAFFIAENALSYLVSFWRSDKVIPSMNYGKVPFEYSTMVVISEYVSSLEQLVESIKHAETVKANSPDDNIQVALLLDLKKSNTQIDVIDKEVEDYLKDYVFNENINIFIRKRTLIDDKYQGWERKRGAILALNKMLMTKNTDEFSLILHPEFPVPEYIVTLDADNMVLPGGVKEMANMIAHPYNQKFDLLSTQNRYNLFSYKKIYSKRFLIESGIDAYPYYTTFYHKLFDKEIYCGKGIYKLSSFYKKMEGVFPENRILSHDIIEGSVLNTGAANIIFEDVPSGFLSDRERRKRWQRGDIQLMPFISGKWHDSEGNICKRKIQPFYKYIMSKNILYNVKELLLFAIVLFGIFTNSWQIVLHFWILFYIPFMFNQMKGTRDIIRNVRFRYIVERKIKNYFLLIEDLFMVGYYAISNTFILISTIIRMAKGKKLLEWKPFYNTQNANKLESYAKEFAIPTLILTAINVVVFFFGYFSMIFSLYVLLSVVMYLRLYYLSSRDYKGQELNQADKKYLYDIAAKTYKYFEFMRTDNGIISDNFQVKPYKGEANVTSPTNIGFSLIAEICAYKLQIITLEKCSYNILKTLSSVEKMEKWKGNLYNWYEIDNLTTVSKFVSSVDSGNFLACLLVVKEFFRDNKNMIGELRTQLIIKGTDLAALYDNGKNLFFLGYDGQKHTGHYDLLSSEARLLSMVFIALYGKNEHYYALHRDYTQVRGNTMLSWSGTMFEYLMPDLFLPLPHFSTLKSTAANVVGIQHKMTWKGVWGVSESAYALFDEKQHYQYHAFGLRELSLRNAENIPVVSPYSSALALPYKTDAVLENFRRLEKMEMLDEYGFFESIDFRKKNPIIYSFMSHHQGMIICAITNKLYNNYIVNLLQNNVKINGCIQMFNENLHKIRNGSINNNTPKISTANKIDYYKYYDNLEQYYNVAAITDASINQIFCANGNNFCIANNIIIDKFVPVYQEATGGYFYVKNENNMFKSPTFLPLMGKPNNFTFSFNTCHVFYKNISDNIELSIALLSGIGGVVRKLSYSKFTKEVAFYMPITLNSFDGYYSHPAFNDLFIETFVENDILYIKRRSMQIDGEDRYFAVLVSGLKNVVWETNRANFVGRNGSLDKPFYLSKDKKKFANPSIGDILSPCVAFSGVPDGTECQVCMVFGASMHELEEKIKLLPSDFYTFANACASNYPIICETQSILGEIIYAPYSNKLMQRLDSSEKIDAFRNYTANRKVISYIYSENKAEKLLTFIEIIKNLQVLGFPIKVVIYVKNKANNNLVEYVSSILRKNIINDFTICEDASILEYSFIAFNEDLQYIRKQVNPVKMEEIYQNIITGVDFEQELPENSFVSGYGCFNFEGNYYQKSLVPTPLPYSNIIAGKYGGIIATNNGGGFYYFNNSRENKVVRFDNDFISDKPFEVICFKNKLGYQILSGGFGKDRVTLIKQGEIIHKFGQNGVNSTMSSFVIYDGKAKVTQLDIDNYSGGYISLIYTLYPCLDWVFEPTFITFKYKENMLEITNLRKNNKVYVRILSDAQKSNVNLEDNKMFPSLEYYCEESKSKIYFVTSQDYDFIKSINMLNLPVMKEQSITRLINPNNITILSKHRSFDLLSNFLSYQILSSRINARAGYYQVGGAIGFRDQLQDCLAFSNSHEIIKNQIIEACMHQYEEGDVMHWWHPPQFGLRTRITDDRMFLPYAVSEYVEFSKNMEFLEHNIPYLHSVPLYPNESIRLENPPYTTYTESVYKHCIRAIKSSLKYGAHGLLIMGSGDWNDGMDHVCSQGKGESVFNSMFAYYVINKFANYCTEATQKELLKIAEELKENINKHCFDTNRYMRLYSDDGRWLGSARSSTLELDLLVQSFAVISGVADKERCEIVLNTARLLVDTDGGLINLLSPPLDKNEYLGYISSYPKGIRENGGQYTHAAMWYLIALVKIGRKNEAFKLFQMLNPVEKGADRVKYAKYKGEPYVLCGDVYSNAQHKGRSGWSWYTGSASWAYRLITEYFFGLKRRGKKLYIYPELPTELMDSVIYYNYLDSTYKIKYKQGSELAIYQDGELKSDNYIILEENKRSEVTVNIN